MQEVLIIGAGMAGISCARTLRQAGVQVRLVERSRGPGGRVASRKLQDSPFDYGPVFLHGQDPDFQKALTQAAGGNLLPDWPKNILGRGTPCQPSAFYPEQFRFAVRGGLRLAALALAEDLDILYGSEIEEILITAGRFQARDGSGRRHEADRLVLALATEQSASLLGKSTQLGMQSILSVMDMFNSLSSLSLAAVYPASTPVPEWDVFYPEEGPFILVSNETAKHGGERLVLQYQTKPGWARQRLEVHKEAWSVEILSEAAELLGTWAGQPSAVHPHRWSYARLDIGSGVSEPVLVERGGALLGLCGELFYSAQGVEAAWLSGKKLAESLLKKG